MLCHLAAAPPPVDGSPGPVAAGPAAAAERSGSEDQRAVAASAEIAPGERGGDSPSGETPDAEGLPGADLADSPVVQLVVEGCETLSEETILHYLGLEVGAPFDPAELDRRVRRLWDRGLLDDLTVESEPVAGGARLTVRIVERPVVSSIEYRGLQRLREAELASRVAAEKVRVSEGAPLRRGELRRLEAAVESVYRERGFPLVEALAAAETAAGGGVAVVVTVDEGDRLRVGELRFEGNTVFSDARLRRAHQESRPAGWMGGWIARLRGRDRFDRSALARDLERVEEVYRRAGYKDATVGEPRVELSGVDGDRELRITVPVEEGERWRLGGIGFSGNRELSDSRLLELFERPASGWLGSRFVEEGIERVRDLYGREGFMTARVEPDLVERQGLTADLMVRIDEGRRYRVGRIEIEGNTDTRDKVLRRELAVQEGQVLDTTALRRSLLRLGQLEFFELAEDEPVRFELDEEDGRVDLTLRGREADPERFFLGGGYGSTHGLFGEIRYSSNNFRGRGHTLGAALQAGANITMARLAYGVPWLLDRRQTLGGELFTREERLDGAGGERLDRELTGGRVSWGRRLGLFQTVSLGYTFRDEVDLRTRALVSGEMALRSLDREVSSLELGYLLDRVNSRFQPSRGLRVSGSLEQAGGALGGDARFLRSRLAADYFRPLSGGRQPRFVLGLHFEGGAVRPLDGAGLSPIDRFFRGGDGSVRGFEALGILPRDASGAPRLDEDGFLLGGDRYLEASAELHLRLNDFLRLVAFTDAGDVWAEDQAIHLGGVRRTAGLELRILTPLFPQPLRFIWAENLDPLDSDRFDSFQFTFGAGF